MLNLLNTIVLFGKEFDWPLENALFWLLIAQVVVILAIVIVFAVLIKRVGKSEVVVSTKPEERSLQGITLDTSMAQRNFNVGEDFNCEGLAVTANYNIDPVSEPIHVITVITHEQYDSLQKSGQIEECYILRPDTSKEGKIAIIVNYRGTQAMYYVAVGQRQEQKNVTVAEEPQPVAERSLTGLTLDLEVVKRDFTVGDAFDCDGLVIKANYSMDPIEETLTDYTLIDKDVFDGIASEELSGCYVIKPDMSSAGKVAVNIRFKDKSAVYMIVVNEAETEPIAEETTAEILPERKLINIDLDLGIVQREFTLGDGFNCDGLIVNAEYNADPRKECVAEYTIISENGFADLSDEEKAQGCYVIVPDLSNAGKKAIEVRYNGQTALYSIAVNEPVHEESAPLKEPSEETLPERELVYIEANTDNVKKDFMAGDAFDCNGLVVTAHFNTEPLEIDIEDYSITVPDMSKEGTASVSIHYQDRTVGYRINIASAPAKEVAADNEPASEVKNIRTIELGDEETSEAGVLRYDKSFTARYIQSSDEIKTWYTKLKNELLSYKKVKARMSWKRETFRYGRETVALLGYRGNTLCIFLPLDPADYVDSRYKVEDVSDSPSYVDTPCMYRLKNEKRVRLAMELFATVMERLGAVRIERVSEDYYLPYEGIVELIDKGLAKRVIKNKADEAIFTQGPSTEEAAADNEPAPEVKHEKPEIVVDFGDEETHEAGVLRYDKSFTARYIQSSDEIKTWYTKLKNELLSYKKVKARMSWKRETFRYGRETVARLGYRGNTLCIFLPLDPAEYVDSRYKVEDVSDSPSYVDTPCMYRLKNEKRVRLAMELFATVMERLGAVRIERISEDYYLPYEGIVELIDKGLAKRVINDKADEAIFAQSALAKEAATDTEPAPASEPRVEELASEEEQPQQVEAETLSEEQQAHEERHVGEGEEAEQTDASDIVEEPVEEPAQPIEESVEEPIVGYSSQTEHAEAEDTPLDGSEEANAQLEEVAKEEPADDEAAEDETPVEETAESEGDVDFSSGLSGERSRLNGKNRKKHRVRK